MFYFAYVHKEAGRWLAEFPDAPGCQTFADTQEESRSAAAEAIEGWLEAHLIAGGIPVRPQLRAVAPDGYELWRLPISPGVSVAVQIRWARHDLGLTQQELARRAGVSQQQIAKLEDPDENPTIKTLAKVSAALGVTVDVSFISAA